MKTYVKDPNATLDYGFNWGPWLNGDTINSSNWIIESGLEAVPASESYDDTTTRIFLTAGVEGMEYEVTNRITTTGGRADDRTMLIVIRQK